ncbi:MULTISPECIES: ribonuclease HII [Prochlorococcus]|uniref:ribonuclease HII n=1 Tax=Prochlorococcus TaxID=1218 RepID=UPI0005339AB1|nr:MULTISPECIES: ribonuclease HII [Prochlorococcus]KGG13530.1 Ribonuclease HII [Prochlorococcus sp. MIT 0601]
MDKERQKVIAGIDEVGKGCLFGPVFASAVVLKSSTEQELLNAGLKDSKKLSSKKRGLLVPLIKSLSASWAIGQASAREIDLYGIRRATEKAMLRAIDGLLMTPELLLVDGPLPIRLWAGQQINLIRGESKSPSIAAASVLAKEARDVLIKRLAIKIPKYSLETNMGYGTKDHRKALRELGTTDLHRKSFLSRIIS